MLKEDDFEKELMEDLSEVIGLIAKMKPKPDDPSCKTPCSSCLGSDCGCCDMADRDPKKECNGWECEVEVKYKDGSKKTIKKRTG